MPWQTGKIVLCIYVFYIHTHTCSETKTRREPAHKYLIIIAPEEKDSVYYFFLNQFYKLMPPTHRFQEDMPNMKQEIFEKIFKKALSHQTIIRACCIIKTPKIAQ